MRTTLTLDDDVAMLLKKFTAESGLTFRDAVNQSIRRGLISGGQLEVVDLPRPRSMGKPLMELTQAIALVDGANDAALIESFGVSRDRS
jgi:hypothetical protein